MEGLLRHKNGIISAVERKKSAIQENRGKYVVLAHRVDYVDFDELRNKAKQARQIVCPEPQEPEHTNHLLYRKQVDFLTKWGLQKTTNDAVLKISSFKSPQETPRDKAESRESSLSPRIRYSHKQVINQSIESPRIRNMLSARISSGSDVVPGGNLNGKRKSIIDVLSSPRGPPCCHEPCSRGVHDSVDIQDTTNHGQNHGETTRRGFFPRPPGGNNKMPETGDQSLPELTNSRRNLGKVTVPIEGIQGGQTVERGTVKKIKTGRNKDPNLPALDIKKAVRIDVDDDVICAVAKCNALTFHTAMMKLAKQNLMSIREDV